MQTYAITKRLIKWPSEEMLNHSGNNRTQNKFLFKTVRTKVSKSFRYNNPIIIASQSPHVAVIFLVFEKCCTLWLLKIVT